MKVTIVFDDGRVVEPTHWAAAWLDELGKANWVCDSSPKILKEIALLGSSIEQLLDSYTKDNAAAFVSLLR